MLINKNLLDNLSAQATENPRLRQHFDLRNTPNDQSQRMLNALELGTQMPIHRHTTTSETLVVLRGSLLETFYDEQGHPSQEFHLQSQGPNYGLNIPKGVYHSLKVLEPNTVIFESKDGPFLPAELLPQQEQK